MPRRVLWVVLAWTGLACAPATVTASDDGGHSEDAGDKPADADAGTDGGAAADTDGGTPDTFVLSVEKAGADAGTVTSDVGGIDCGASCSHAYPAGTRVSLAATTTGLFAGWSGGCTGTGPCEVTMDAAKSVTATFTLAEPGCPTGVRCITRPWPIMPEEKYTMSAQQVLAIQVATTAAGLSGSFTTNYTTGNTASREIALSTRPGDFAVSAACLTWGLEATVNRWVQGPGGARNDCPLPVNGTAYVNIRFTNCAGGPCSFFMRNN